MRGNIGQITPRQAMLAGALAAAGLLGSGPAAAQASRTWVSGNGNDANSCTRTSPCRTFAGALGKTSAGGEIDCLDPGDYSPVTITKSIILSCNGIGNGGIVANSSGDAIVINAGVNDVVVIDGLELAGGGTGDDGIYVNQVGALIVRNTTIRNFDSYGIYFEATSTATLNVDSTAVIASGRGITIFPLYGASVRANISRSQLSNNEYGVRANASSTTGSVFISVRSSTIVNSTTNGVYTSAGGALFATIALDEVTVSGSTGAGLYATGARAGMLVNNTTITNNQGGGVVPNSGGVIYSYGNNRVNGNNGQDGSFTGTLVAR